MADEQRREFYISPKLGLSGTLRISRAFSGQFSGKTDLHGRVSTPDGQEYPVVLNVPNRTLDGLKIWRESLPEEQDWQSFRVSIETEDPLLLSISPSDTPVPPEGEDRVDALTRPEEGLFLGRVLEDQFNELVATNDPFVIQESDLLTHTFICGVTGAGKTVIGKALLEEAALKGIPVIAIDLKGDISSLALMMSGDDPEELIPWVSPGRDKTREQVAVHLAVEHRRKLDRCGISSDFVEEAKKSIGVNVFTPRSNDGFRLSLSAFPEPPDNLPEMRESDPDAYDSLIDFLSQQFVSRLTLNKKQSQKAKGYRGIYLTPPTTISCGCQTTRLSCPRCVVLAGLTCISPRIRACQCLAVRGHLAVTDAASGSTGILRCFAIVCMWPIPRQSTTCWGRLSQVNTPKGICV